MSFNQQLRQLCFRMIFMFCGFVISGLTILHQPAIISAQIFGLPTTPSNCDPCEVPNEPCPDGKKLQVIDRDCNSSSATPRVQCPVCLDQPLKPTASWCQIPVCPDVKCGEKQSLLIDGGSGFGKCYPPRCTDATCTAEVDNNPYTVGTYYCVRCADCCPNEPTSCADGERLVKKDKRCDTRTIQCNVCESDTNNNSDSECNDSNPGEPLSKITKIESISDKSIRLTFQRGTKPFTSRRIVVGASCGDNNLGDITLNGDLEIVDNDTETYSWTLGYSYDELKDKCFRMTVNNGCKSAQAVDFKLTSSTPTPTPTPTSSEVDDLPITGISETSLALLILGILVAGGGVYARLKNKNR